MSMHPPLYPLLAKERWLSYLKSALGWKNDDLEIAESLLDKELIPIVHGPEIGHFLGVSPKIVTRMAQNPDRFYNIFEVKKRNGSSRQITAPRLYLKQV